MEQQLPQDEDSDTYFKQVYLDWIDESNIDLLDKAVKSSYYGYEVSHVLPELQQFKMQLWEGSGDGVRFVVITQMTNYPAGRELMIWAIGGEGYIKSVDLVFETLTEFAKMNRCRWLTCQVTRKAFDKVCKKFNPDTKLQQLVVEIDNATTK